MSGARAVLAHTPDEELETRLAELAREEPSQAVRALWGHVSASRVRSAGARSPRHVRDSPARWLGDEDEGQSSWVRVVLAPGVELHYQRSESAQRLAAIQAIAREAVKRLSEFE